MHATNVYPSGLFFVGRETFETGTHMQATRG